MLQTVGKDDGSSPRFQRPKMHPRIAGAEEAITHHGQPQKTAKELSYGAGVANQGNPLKSPWQDILVGELGPEHLYPCPELDEGLGLSVGIVGLRPPGGRGKRSAASCRASPASSPLFHSIKAGSSCRGAPVAPRRISAVRLARCRGLDKMSLGGKRSCTHSASSWACLTPS